MCHIEDHIRFISGIRDGRCEGIRIHVYGIGCAAGGLNPGLPENNLTPCGPTYKRCIIIILGELNPEKKSSDHLFIDLSDIENAYLGISAYPSY